MWAAGLTSAGPQCPCFAQGCPQSPSRLRLAACAGRQRGVGLRGCRAQDGGGGACFSRGRAEEAGDGVPCRGRRRSLHGRRRSLSRVRCFGCSTLVGDSAHCFGFSTPVVPARACVGQPGVEATGGLTLPGVGSRLGWTQAAHTQSGHSQGGFPSGVGQGWCGHYGGPALHGTLSLTIHALPTRTGPGVWGRAAKRVRAANHAVCHHRSRVCVAAGPPAGGGSGSPHGRRQLCSLRLCGRPPLPGRPGVLSHTHVKGCDTPDALRSRGALIAGPEMFDHGG